MEKVDAIAFPARGAAEGDLRLRLARRSFPELKAAADFVLAGLFLLLSSPVLLVAAILIKLDSRGPVLHVQRRVGKDGRIFRMWKLRTMVEDAEARCGPVWARRDDPRITRVGRILRATHLDELPQLVNVLRGEMSLVGPRPERPVLVRILSDAIPHYHRRHAVRPGITGLAQIHHRYDESLEDVRRKLAYDLLYIRRMGWATDFRILLSTVIRVLRMEIR